jgi:hypothetical protein
MKTKKKSEKTKGVHLKGAIRGMGRRTRGEDFGNLRATAGCGAGLAAGAARALPTGIRASAA